MELAIGILHLKDQVLLPLEHLHIDQIPRGDAIDAEQAIAGLEPQLVADRTGFHAGHHGGIGQTGWPWRRSAADLTVNGGGLGLGGDPRRRLLPHRSGSDLPSVWNQDGPGAGGRGSGAQG